ncbi:hypothetical protein MCOR27_007578 [Pyricularia oryzae]|uniref:Uncharacterized protein n=2 Tax=Pyricularia TaxID=48558 RepID=A0ABQ8NTF6_PYRGI|nr:hypothetical protein MCOR01_007167 [Pyricularia oryzae]KAI6301906.1 hypothetical protein MCOR33_002743 [Pyricularia grisea]KAH9434244.1 hypothetical protein MCOR02_006263 [Pyricularia oryzae]KAI6262953.1 hypothetical protein MCOR19_000934 [Pyricularia oryzae]KAI6274088.1 hypothetical protein MCOR27_007578 [Pyricularia oryzae]
MAGKDGCMRVFWPIDLAQSSLPGVIVGWRNSELDVFVVAILDDVQPRDVDFALKSGTLLRSTPHPISRIYGLCEQPSMQVLGLANMPDAPQLEPAWIMVTTGPKLAVQIDCAKAYSFQIVTFRRPLPGRMQFVSADPISLALDDKPESLGILAGEIEADDERRERLEKEKKKLLVKKLRDHSVIKRRLSPKEKALPRIVNQINCAWELEQLLQKNASRIGPRNRLKRSLSVSERMVESATTARDTVAGWLWDLVRGYVLPVIKKMFIATIIFYRFAAEFMLRLLEWRPRPRYGALKDVSATAQQVEIRLQQFCYWPMQYLTLRRRKNDWESVTGSHLDYIRFYNSLWLVANDVIIGIALGSYIIENAEWVAEEISSLLGTYTVDALQTSISWLMGWPAGLKLNSELAAFLGDLFLWVIAYWAGCLEALRPGLPYIIWFVGYSSFAGASLPIALFSDLLSLLSVHINSFYLASARIYNWQLTILISLSYLFRGKKHNVLRNRIDSCDYGLDQLLVGTILFTVLSFLLPTVVVFYLNFAIWRMVIISIKAVSDMLLSCLNHFPLFAIMLRLKDSRRLPGGIYFTLRCGPTATETAPGKTSSIELHSIPLSYGAIFHQYFQMGDRLRKHYLSLEVLICLLTGKFVPPMNRKILYSLQYSMLPAKRPGIMETWEALGAESSSETTWTATRRQPWLNQTGSAGKLPRRARGGR